MEKSDGNGKIGNKSPHLNHKKKVFTLTWGGFGHLRNRVKCANQEMETLDLTHLSGGDNNTNEWSNEETKKYYSVSSMKRKYKRKNIANHKPDIDFPSLPSTLSKFYYSHVMVPFFFFILPSTDRTSAVSQTAWWKHSHLFIGISNDSLQTETETEATDCHRVSRDHEAQCGQLESSKWLSEVRRELWMVPEHCGHSACG